MNNILVGAMVLIFIAVTIFAVRMDNGKNGDTEDKKNPKDSRK